MSRNADVVIVGGGIIGLFAAHALKKAGVEKITLVEKERVGSGASGKSGALMRMHYTNPHDASLALSSRPTYERWPEVIGTDVEVFQRTGFLMPVPEHLLDTARANVEMLRGIGVDTVLVSPKEMKEIDPSASIDGVAGAAYEPGGGYVDGALALATLTAALRRERVSVNEGEATTDIIERDGRIVGVETTMGAIHADWVVLTAGAWSRKLLQRAGIPADFLDTKRVLIRLIAWPDSAPASHPVYIDHLVGTYFRADLRGRFTLGGAKANEWGIDPDTTPTTIDDRANGAFTALAKRLPWLADGTPTGGRSAVEGWSRDGHAVVGPVKEGLIVATGMSGTGFKKAPGFGKAIAAYITTGFSPVVDVFTPHRFVDGRHIEGEHTYETLANTGTKIV